MNRARSLSAVFLACSLLSTTPAFSQTAPPAKVTSDATREAGRHFQRAVALFNEADYAGALAEFKKANELAPAPTVLFNIGQTYFQLRAYAQALETFERYLAEAGPSAEHLTEAEANVETLRSRVGKIEIVASDGSDITIDDDLAGKAPLPPIQASVGRRKVVVFTNGVQQVRFVEVAAGETVRVDLKMIAQPRRDPGAEPSTGSSSSKTLPTALWIGSGALLAGAVVTGVLALGASSDLSDDRGKPAGQVTRGELDDAQSKTKNLALVTDILGGCAIVAGGFALYFTLNKPSAAASAAPALNLQVGVSHLALGGTF